MTHEEYKLMIDRARKELRERSETGTQFVDALSKARENALESQRSAKPVAGQMRQAYTV
ncbi:hypothetical protein [Neptuniibacter sp.]|uniref:hypothetical protein n=1 Tax=Neptuniibacter sp. TaxID=1962643 RepID=UPI003B5A1AED